MNPGFKSSGVTFMWILLICMLLIRLFSLGVYPLSDTTEARYSEMGRLMVETRDWVTPQFEKGTPFWGKPPLSFWLTAISFKLFGIHEFSARLPSFIIALIAIGMVFRLGLFQSDQKRALIASVVMTSTLVFWVNSGAVMTDSSLLAGTTLSMLAYWRCAAVKENHHFWWGILFFIGLSIGLMAKGPVAVVLIFFPICVWVCIQRKPISLIRKLPWKAGVLITILLTLPWYINAELKTPGFLEYFLIGEHLYRFLIPGWEGDLYGSAHSQTKGTIWVFWIIGTLPWSVFLILQFWDKKQRKVFITSAGVSGGWYSYLVLWATAPMVFFTMAGNILWAYVLPGIPAFALLTSEIFYLKQRNEVVINKISSVMVVLFLIATIIVSLGVGPEKYSQKKMINRFNDLSDGEKIYYLQWRPYSAEFYSRGQAGEIKSLSQMPNIFENHQTDYLVAKENYISHIPDGLLVKIEKLAKINEYILFKEK